MTQILKYLSIRLDIYKSHTKLRVESENQPRLALKMSHQPIVTSLIINYAWNDKNVKYTSVRSNIYYFHTKLPVESENQPPLALKMSHQQIVTFFIINYLLRLI